MLRFSPPYKHIAVFGLARAGLAAAQCLQANGAVIYAWDDSSAAIDAAQQAGVNTHNILATWPDEVECLVVAPGVPLTHKPHPVVAQARARNIPVIGDMDVFQWARQAFASPHLVFGITGTNGKSTTSALLAHVLAQFGYDVFLGGNIGTSVLRLPPPKKGRPGIYVLELSSYQLDLLDALQLDGGAWLNLTPDHLARHGSLEHYIAAKARLFDAVRPQGLVVLGMDEAELRAFAHSWTKTRAPLYRISAYGHGGDLTFDGKNLYDPSGVCRLSLASCPALLGAHNAQNAAAAYGLLIHAMAAMPPPIAPTRQSIQTAFESFQGLAHRLQPVATIGAVRIINDSKATNVDATAVALASFARTPIYWIAGGRSKDDGLAGLTEFQDVRIAYLIGEAAHSFGAYLDSHKVVTRQCGTLPVAVDAAWDDAQRDSEAILLFSPACASFDQYEDFEARGDAFCALIAALKDKQAGARSTP